MCAMYKQDYTGESRQECVWDTKYPSVRNADVQSFAEALIDAPRRHFPKDAFVYVVQIFDLGN